MDAVEDKFIKEKLRKEVGVYCFISDEEELFWVP